LRELNEDLAALDGRQKEMSTAVERMEQERALWSSGDADLVYESRARVARLLKRFISTMSINFEQKTVMVGVAGGLRGYMFDRKGSLIDRYDMSSQINRVGRRVMFAERDPDGRPDFENAIEIRPRGPSLEPFINISGNDHFDDVVGRRQIVDTIMNGKKSPAPPKI
jgi:hypothetical protein